MHLTSPLTRLRRRARAVPTPTQERDQRAEATQDAALYTCSCGYIFKADVSTSVGCPHCGCDQAW